ncbi:Gfo/Idh/MocA family oxidoreductase [soil metagenome]
MAATTTTRPISGARTQAGPVRLLVIGAGSRGSHAYGQWCLEHPDRARVVAVADPNEERRDSLARQHDVATAGRFRSWREALAEPGAWDAVVIATPDRLHVDPAVRALELGSDVLLEKPIAPTVQGLNRLVEAARLHPGAVTVAHVLRYTPFFTAVKRALDEGRVGALQGIQHTENIGYWHFAHSYVRGNWNRSDTSSPMLLAKACHDLDIIRWLVGARCAQVSSFGGLRHFRAEVAPAGSTERCIDGCAVADSCPYNAERFYVEELADVHGPPVTALTLDTSPEGRRRALRGTDYGRCVYRMNNDVVDHQTTSLRYADGVTTSLVVSAFTAHNTRTLTVMGSHGQLIGDMRDGRVTITDFGRAPAQLSGQVTAPVESEVLELAGTDVSEDVSEAFAGHGGGDAALMAAFTDRVQSRRGGSPTAAALTSLEESIDSHLVAFAAEQARLTGSVVDLATFADEHGLRLRSGA